MKSIVLHGTEFIKASDAAKAHGYTTDYIGQLCRSGKIEAQLVGRTWYVTESSLLQHRKNRYRSSQKKTKEAIKEVIEKQTETTKEKLKSRFYSQIVSGTNIAYGTDTDELIPTPQKIAVVAEPVETDDIPVNVARTPDGSREHSPRAPDVPKLEKPRRGVLTIIEDVSDAPFTLDAAETDVPVRIEHRQRADRSQHSPAVTPMRVKSPPLSSSRFSSGRTQSHRGQSTTHRARTSTTPATRAATFVAPLSLSLLAGLAVAAVLVGLSWQFQSLDGTYTETYKVQMSSLMYK